MGKNFGEIELGQVFGGYEIVNAAADKLPQEVASAVSVINGGTLGATYQPIVYVGKQTVNGVNHLLICEEIRTTKGKGKMIVGLVINVPPGEGSIRGEGAKAVNIIEEADLSPEVQAAFDTAEKQLVGVGYKPIAYVGSQVVRGVNHYFICEARGIYPGAEPYAALVAVNVFEGNASIVGILPVKGKTQEGNTLFGYSFTW